MPKEPRSIPFARPYIGPEEEEAVLRVLRSGWLTTGKEALAFESEFAAFLEHLPQMFNTGAFFRASPEKTGLSAPTPHRRVTAVAGFPLISLARPEGKQELSPLRSLAVNSATSGLHLALEALGVGPGDVALVPSYTFTSTAEVVRYLGAEAAFVDLIPGTFHISPENLRTVAANLAAGKKAYGSHGPAGRPKAVLPVHFGGLPCDMDTIMAVAGEYGLSVVEDCAHCFPSCTAEGRAPGTFGDAGVFSFYATKTITTGEGGMVVCRDPAIAERISVMRLHGIDRPAWNRYTDVASSWYYEIVGAGYKYNLPDILAAIGREQLKRALFLLEERRRLAAIYDAAFSAHPALLLPPSGPACAHHLYPLRVADPARRAPLIESLQKAGIGVSVHFIPLHTMPYYKTRYGMADSDLPHTMAAFTREISLPLWPGMTAEDAEYVAENVLSGVK
jgi:dTDP-4-amino-4,6-dideoxygalactose transaminase